LNLPSPAREALPSEQGRQRQLRVLVPARADARHDFATLGFRKDVSHDSIQRPGLFLCQRDLVRFHSLNRLDPVITDQLDVHLALSGSFNRMKRSSASLTFCGLEYLTMSPRFMVVGRQAGTGALFS